MLAHCKELLGYRSGQVAIHPRFNKLITSLRTAENGECPLDKEATAMMTLWMHLGCPWCSGIDCLSCTNPFFLN
ncbi:MAG: hypothetical protein WAM26_06680 [Nitrososphaeraceae archaeon]